MELNSKMSTVKHKTGSFDLFIPQIELDEFEDISFLSATLVGDDSSICTFTEAVQKFELAFDQRDSSTGFHQFSARLFPTLAITNNMIDKSNQVNSFIQDCPNINSVWANHMVEECTRLGLTYFCVAPGSRSSPLTIAASNHPLTTCIVCIDERSLAFHALGYAKVSNKPAVIITSSGTASLKSFPAVVEASQNFVPLIVLSADRPPELVDIGAN